jgi:hypothetical protein
MFNLIVSSIIPPAIDFVKQIAITAIGALCAMALNWCMRWANA